MGLGKVIREHVQRYMRITGIRVEETKQRVPRLEPKPGVHRLILLHRPTELVTAAACGRREDVAPALSPELPVVGLRRGEGAGEGNVDKIRHRSWGKVDRNFLRDRVRNISLCVHGRDAHPVRKLTRADFCRDMHPAENLERRVLRREWRLVPRSVFEVEQILEEPELLRSRIAHLDAEPDEVRRPQTFIDVHGEETTALSSISRNGQPVGRLRYPKRCHRASTEPTKNTGSAYSAIIDHEKDAQE